MKSSKILKSVTLIMLFIATTTFAQEKAKIKKGKIETKMVGGAEMYPNKDIISNAVNSNDHTTLVAAVKAAGLVETLQDEGPFTVFAPTNEAFSKLPKGTVESLLKQESKKKLQAVLTYHVITGNHDAKSIMKAIKKSNGMTTFKTVNGGKLTAMLDGKMLKLKDANGNISTVTIADVHQSNGIIHVVDTVILPKM